MRFLVVIICATFTSGCLLSYLVKSGYNQASLLLDREPIEKVLKREDLKPEIRHKLELALQIQEFTKQKLRLNLSDNYKTYVDLGRPYVTYIVTAADKTKLEPYLYWFPLVGKVPYKGFFDKKEADEAAKEFDKNQYDVMVRGVSAYSTLGWFDDPLLSSMITGDDQDLVQVIIHESTHSTIYINGQANFNEQLATFVGQIGTEIYYREKEGPESPTLKKIADENRDDHIFSEFMKQELANLSSWYKDQQTHRDELFKKKMDRAQQEQIWSEFYKNRQEQFALMQKRFISDWLPKMRSSNYKRFATAQLNNAVLLHYKTYMDDLSEFEALYNRLGKDFYKFMEFSKGLEKSKDPRAALKAAIKEPTP